MSFGHTEYRIRLETFILVHEYVHIRSPKRPLTIHCTFRSLLRPKTRIMFTREPDMALHRTPGEIRHKYESLLKQINTEGTSAEMNVDRMIG